MELTDIVASLFSAAAIVGLLRVWQPGEPLIAEAPRRRRRPAIAGASTHAPALEREIEQRQQDGTIDPRSRSCAPTRPT